MISPDDLIGEPITTDYVPQSAGLHFLHFENRPWFRRRWHVPLMETDPRVAFATYLLKGPMKRAEFRIEPLDLDPAIHDFLQKQIRRFWRTGANLRKALKCIEWGWSGAEVLYRASPDPTETSAVHDGPLIHFDRLKFLHPGDISPVLSSGDVVGLEVGNHQLDGPTAHRTSGTRYVGRPRSVWWVHEPEHDPFYGNSRYRSPFGPWWEKITRGGAKDSRRLFFVRHAIGNYVVYHPPGSTVTKDGTVVNWQNDVRQGFDSLKAGGVLYLPDIRREGQRQLEVQPLTTSSSSAEILEYLDRLDKEIFDGIGIPSEVIEAEQGTLGTGGRAVPQEAFFCILQEIVDDVFSPFDRMALRPLVEYNFGRQVAETYEVIPVPLGETATRQANPETAGQSVEDEAQATDDFTKTAETADALADDDAKNGGKEGD